MLYENNNPANRIIAESKNFYIKCQYEAASIYRKSNDISIADVGDFYGDPSDGIIDWNEKFCVTVGCGYIIYFLKDPFESYSYDRTTSQWIESGRNPDSIHWIKMVRQISDNEVELIDENDNIEIIKIPL